MGYRRGLQGYDRASQGYIIEEQRGKVPDSEATSLAPCYSTYNPPADNLES